MKQKYFKGLTRNTFLLAFTSFFADISTEMLYPVIPIFLTTYLNVGGSIVGIVEGVATATQYIQMGISGYISDRFHKHKTLAAIGYALAAFSKPLIGFSRVWQGVLGARFLDRLGTGTRSAPRYSLVAQSASEENRGKAFGLEGFGDNLGAFLGPLLTLAILFYFKIEIHKIFYLAFIPGILALVMVLFVNEKKERIKAKYKLDLNLKNFPKSYWRYLKVIAIFGIGNISSSFMILQTKNVGVPLVVTILIYAFFNLVAALASYPAGFLSDKLGRKSMLFAAFTIFLSSLIGFSVARNVFVIAGLFALYGIYQGIFRTVGNAYASDFVPQELRASAIGWFNMTVGITGLIASVTAGQIYDKIGHTVVFAAAAAAAAAFVFFGIFFLFRLKEENFKN